MKKFLLLSAVALGMATAQADDFGNYFKVMFDGKEVENGSTVNVKGHYIEGLEEFGLFYEGDFKVLNLGDEARPLYGAFEYVNPAKASDYPAEWLTKPKLCFEGGGAAGNEGTCLSGSDTAAGLGNVVVPAAGIDTFSWKADYEGTSESADATLNLLMIAQDADGDIDGAEFNVTVVFKYQGSGVEGITADNGAVEYYNLQGMRVANPEKGIYIVKQGDKVTKRVF